MNDQDQVVVAAIIARDAEVTRQIFYVQYYPLFKAVYDKYYTDCSDCIEFINEIYIHLLSPNKKTGICKLEQTEAILKVSPSDAALLIG